METYQTRGNGPCNQASDPSLYWPMGEKSDDRKEKSHR